jgi:hypothetical protein
MFFTKAKTKVHSVVQFLQLFYQFRKCRLAVLLSRYTITRIGYNIYGFGVF